MLALLSALYNAMTYKPTSSPFHQFRITLSEHLQHLQYASICFVNLQGVKNVLSQAYADATQVTDELVDCILQPGLQVSSVAKALSRGLCCWPLETATIWHAMLSQC